MAEVTEVDVVVVGMGPGGEDAAGRLAEAGLDVIGVEAGLVGGECPYYGCIPSKMMIRAGDALAEGRRVNGLAGKAEIRASWDPVAARLRKATADWDDKAAADRFTGKGGRLVRGFGRVSGPREVTVGERVLRARRGLVLNPGTEPVVPPIEGLEDTPFWTNREAVKTTRAPESLLVLGGGAIGVELAQAFARFGSRVTVLEGGERLVSREEPEAAELITKVFEQEGIAVRTGQKVERVRYADGRFTVEAGGNAFEAERFLVATGRKTDLARLGVGKAGLDESARAIPVDGRMRAADGVWAIGDVTGKGAFTHVSMYQAGIAVRDILGEDGPPADYRALPRVTFTDPEVGAVGLTEAQARDKGLDVRTGYTPLSSSSRGWIHEAEGFIKLVAAGDELVGATTAGPAGGEVMSALAVAVHGRVPVSSLTHMIYAYPTFHRAIETALADLGKG
ncbi:NAD(P)/FAD-dependent oxidoreductase [Actinocorallia libanotica]|uniref:NAD(P)/FAD-dependent oxidoreductase n=1 Tax=Actinocorallia libanotica TaxID=46162 RepID=A0ABN1Q034_9ACTN